MKTKIRYSIILIVCLFSTTMKAQVVIKGYVRDSSEQIIPFSNIIVQVLDTSPIIAYTLSDATGFYSLEIPFQYKRFWIKSSLIGYSTKSKLVELEEKQSIIELNFILEQQVFVLNEAIITGSSRVVERNDTVTFNADRFRDSTERNLEELLAKLPGVEVSKDGGISVQGKPIKKILIDGDDLTGRNYQLVSKNMAADIIDKIQIIDKFNDNKLLKGIKKSDDKVLNITLKNKNRGFIFGNISLGLGNEWRSNNSLNLMSIHKKFKMVHFGGFNTTGQRSDADRMMNMETLEDNESLRLNPLINYENTGIININRISDVNLGSQNVRFNNAKLWSSHILTRPSAKTLVKGTLTYSADNVKTFTHKVV